MKWQKNKQETNDESYLLAQKKELDSTDGKLRFQEMLEIAKRLETIDGLQNYLRFLGRVVEAEIITNSMVKGKRRELPQALPLQEYLLFAPDAKINSNHQSLQDLMVEKEPSKVIQLGIDTVLPQPRKQTRLNVVLIDINPGGILGEWQQDDNHNVIWWEPLQVGWVNSGHHSIASGIINKQGNIIPSLSFDISPVYEHVTCDGDYYYCKHSGHAISFINSVEFAVMFEIGRLIFEKQDGMK